MTARRAVAVWWMLFVAAFANGGLRQGLYGGWISEIRAHQVSCVTGIALFGAVIGRAAKWWPLGSRGQAARIGMGWMAATVAFEFLFMHYAAGHSWRRLVADYEIWNGRMWALVLASLVLWPVAFATGRQKG